MTETAKTYLRFFVIFLVMVIVFIIPLYSVINKFCTTFKEKQQITLVQNNREISASPKTVNTIYPATLVRVVDGDTFVLRIEIWKDMELIKKIRLMGVDTPELHPKIGTEEDKTAEVQKAILAKEFSESTMKNRVIYFQFSGQEDSFGRALGSIIWEDGEKIIDIREELKKSQNLKKGSKWNE